jgi:hypothetical protein
MSTQARAPWERRVSEIEEKAERYIALRTQHCGIGRCCEADVRRFAEWVAEQEAERQEAERQAAPGGVKR